MCFLTDKASACLCSSFFPAFLDSLVPYKSVKWASSLLRKPPLLARRGSGVYQPICHFFLQWHHFLPSIDTFRRDEGGGNSTPRPCQLIDAHAETLKINLTDDDDHLTVVTQPTPVYIFIINACFYYFKSLFVVFSDWKEATTVILNSFCTSSSVSCRGIWRLVQFTESDLCLLDTVHDVAQILHVHHWTWFLLVLQARVVLIAARLHQILLKPERREQKHQNTVKQRTTF